MEVKPAIFLWIYRSFRETAYYHSVYLVSETMLTTTGSQKSELPKNCVASLSWRGSCSTRNPDCLRAINLHIEDIEYQIGDTRWTCIGEWEIYSSLYTCCFYFLFFPNSLASRFAVLGTAVSILCVLKTHFGHMLRPNVQFSSLIPPYRTGYQS